MRAGVVAFVVALCACAVHRKSDGVKLDSGAGSDAEQLDAPVCPAECNGGCTFGTGGSTCTINGAGGGDITCPADFHCTIVCAGGGACGEISCTAAASCDVTCVGTTGSGPAACGTLSCGTHKCSESCTGSGACGNLACASSCNCNAECTPLDACATMTCPRVGNKYCAVGGTTGGVCDSSAFPQCTSCP